MVYRCPKPGRIECEGSPGFGNCRNIERCLFPGEGFRMGWDCELENERKDFGWEAIDRG